MFLYDYLSYLPSWHTIISLVSRWNCCHSCLSFSVTSICSISGCRGSWEGIVFSSSSYSSACSVQSNLIMIGSKKILQNLYTFVYILTYICHNLYIYVHIFTFIHTFHSLYIYFTFHTYTLQLLVTSMDLFHTYTNIYSSHFTFYRMCSVFLHS